MELFVGSLSWKLLIGGLPTNELTAIQVAPPLPPLPQSFFSVWISGKIGFLFGDWSFIVAKKELHKFSIAAPLRRKCELQRRLGSTCFCIVTCNNESCTRKAVQLYICISLYSLEIFFYVIQFIKNTRLVTHSFVENLT